MNEIDTEPSPGVATNDDGADGDTAGAAGVTDTGSEAVPVPTEFTDRSLTLYDVPFVRPLTVTGDDVPASASAQLLPPSVEN